MGTVHKSWWGQALHNRLIALVLAMVVGIPLLASPADNHLRGLAAFAFESTSLLLLLMLVLRAKFTFTRQDVARFALSGPNLPLLLLGGVAALSTLTHPNGYAVQEMLRLGAGLLLFFAIGAQFRRSEQLSKLVDALLFVTLGASLIGFAQYSGGSGLHATGLFGDHQLFGSFLMLLLPIVGVVAITERAPNRQLVAQAATVCAATCLLLTQARSAWVGAAAGLLTLGAMALLSRFRAAAPAPRVRKHEVVVPVMLLVIACGFFVLLWPQTDSLVQRFSTLQSASQDSTVQLRQQSWAAARQMVAGHPFTGVGLGQFALLQKQYTGQGAPLLEMGGRGSLAEQAHSLYLQTAAELGLPGLLLLVAALVAFWVSGVKRWTQMDAGLRRSLLMGSLAASVAFAADAFASPSWQCGQVSMFLWLVLGTGAACMRRVSHAKESVEEAEAKPMLSPRVLRPASAAGVLALAALLPSVAFATSTVYLAPVRAFLAPIFRLLPAGQSQAYTLTVQFNDGSLRNVTLLNGSGPGSAKTTFSKALQFRIPGTPQGGFTGPNNSVYKSVVNEAEVFVITGTYTQTAGRNSSGQQQAAGTVSAQGVLGIGPFGGSGVTVKNICDQIIAHTH